MKNHTKLLAINYATPPRKAIASVRNYYLINELSKYVSETYVFTTSNSKILPKDEMDLTHINKQYLLETIDIKTIKHWVSKVKKSVKSNERSGVLNTGHWLHKAINTFPFGPFIFDGGLLYVAHGILKGLFVANNQTIIYSSFRPLADHIIAYVLKTIYPSAYWIVDYRDVYSFPSQNDCYFPKFQDWIHKKIISKSNIFTAVSLGHIEYFSTLGLEASLLRNAFTSSPSQDTDEVTTVFRIVYTGQLYGLKRNPTRIFEAISLLLESSKIPKNKLEVVYAGGESKIWDSLIGKYPSIPNKNYGMISRNESLILQKESSVNLLMNWNEPGLLGGLSGKLFEYIGAQKPILALIDGDKDPEIEDVLNTLGLGTVFYDRDSDIIPMAKFIENAFNRWKQTGVSKINVADEILKKFTWGYGIENILSKLN